MSDCFIDDVMPDLPNDSRCIAFADYIVETYVAEEARFPPELWAAVPPNEMKRTNNGPEAFHSHFNQQFYAAHPSIFVFMDVLLKLQTVTYIKIRGLDAPANMRRAEKNKMEFLLEKYQMYNNKDINRIQYVRAIAYKFQPINDV